jgi:anti-anti-sigma factor
MFGVELVVREHDDHVIVVLRGELDMADAACVTDALTAAAAGRRKTVVDLAGLAFIDCTGAVALARAQRRVRRAGGSLLLAAPQTRVRRVFVLSRLIEEVSLYTSVDQATGSAKSSVRLRCRDRSSGHCRQEVDLSRGEGQASRLRRSRG